MQIEGLTPVYPVDNLEAAVKSWSALLGVAPTFVDGDRWAQFDVAGKRVALAGTDRVADVPGLMVKVADVAAARDQAVRLGLETTPLQDGPHETRCTVTAAGGWPVVLYSPKK